MVIFLFNLHLCFPAGLREYFSQTDERSAAPRIPVMVDMASVPSKRNQKLNDIPVPHHRSPSLDQMSAANKNAAMLDEYSDEDEDFQVADQEVYIALSVYHNFFIHYHFNHASMNLYRKGNPSLKMKRGKLV